MVIEVAGVWFFAESHMNDMAGKFITQFVVLALNYIFSKFWYLPAGEIMTLEETLKQIKPLNEEK